MTISVVAEVMYLKDKKKGTLEPNSQGIYEKFPVAGLDFSSRNNTYYDSKTFLSDIQNPNTNFGRKIANGALTGEYQHPNIEHLRTESDQLRRLVRVDEMLTSHWIQKIHQEPLETGGILVLADIYPYGTKRSDLEHSLRSPANTAFSLRAITNTIPKTINGKTVSYKTTRSLVTFDHVNEGGFWEATKVHSDNFSVENIDIKAVQTDGFSYDVISLETLTDNELNDILKTNEIEVSTKRSLFISDDEKSILSESKFRDSIVSLMQR